MQNKATQQFEIILTYNFMWPGALPILLQSCMKFMIINCIHVLSFSSKNTQKQYKYKIKC